MARHGAVDTARPAHFLMRLGRLKLGAMTGDSDDSASRASSSPFPPPPSSSPPPTPPQPQQPRWAWWVVGVLIPVIGIIVTLIVSNQGSSPSAGSKPSADVTESADSTPPASPKPSTDVTDSTNSTPTATAGHEGTGEKSPKIRFGPELLELPEGDENIDLDSNPPLVLRAITRGTDLGISSSPLSLSTLNGMSRLAPLPSSDSDPSEAECTEQVQNNGTYNLDLTKGTRYCAVSREGRTAYLRAVAAPTEGTVRLEVTVWELPS